MSLIKQRAFILEVFSWFYDGQVALTVLLLVPSIIYLALRAKSKNDEHRKSFLALTVTSLFAFFMMSRPSSFVWYYFSFLQKLQFPIRWLSVLSLLGVLAFVWAVSRLILLQKHLMRLYVYGALFLVLSIMIFDITQSIMQSQPMSRVKFDEIVNGLQTKSGHKPWWTVWAKEQAFERRERASAENRSIDIELWDLEKREFAVEAGDPATSALQLFIILTGKRK
jgi:hypothetical protein